MAFHPGSLADDWGDYLPLFEGRSTYNTHDVHSCGTYPEDQQVLENAFISNNHSSADDIDRLAYDTNLNAGPCRLSEHSDSVNATAPLQLPAQDDHLLFNSGGWVGNGDESIADSGSYSNLSVETRNQQHLEAHNYSNPSFSQDIDKVSSSNVLKQETNSNDLLTVPSAGAPWHPGSRLNQQDYSADAIYNFSEVGRSHHSVTGFDQSSQVISDYSESASIPGYIPPHTTASEDRGSGRSRKGYTSITSHDKVKRCDHCGAQFTGQYRRGNCARHVRQRHAGNPMRPSQDCVCRVCEKQFHRQDARRKHEWKKHQLPDTKPCLRRQPAGLECDTSHVGTHDTASDQGTLTATATATFAIPEDTAINLRFRVPNHFQQAHNAFKDIKAKLANDDQYDSYCQQFLARCTRIVGELEHAQSSLYGIFAQELQSLSFQLIPDQSLSSTQHVYDEEYVHDVQDTLESNDSKGASSSQDRGKAPMSRRTSRASSRFDPYGGRPSKSSGADTMVAIIKLFNDAHFQELDCPIHKWNLVHGRSSPCNGCGKRYMNGVRQHLGPQYSQQHQGKITFIQRCATCAEDFVDRNIWDLGGHSNGRCHGRSQPQGHNLVCWARLYLKIYPEETRVPSPYRNDPRLLPANLVAQLRAELHLPQVMTHSSQQTPLLSLPSSSNQITRPESGDSDRSPEQVATLAVLINQAIVLLARFLAEEYIESVHERIDISDIEDDFHARLHALRHTSSHPALHDPATGGAADFTTPAYQPYPFLTTLQIPTSTVPSSHEPFDFPAASSHTSYDMDFAASPFGVPPQQAPLRFYTAASPSACPPSPELWPSPEEAQTADNLAWHEGFEDDMFYEDVDGGV